MALEHIDAFANAMSEASTLLERIIDDLATLRCKTMIQAAGRDLYLKSGSRYIALGLISVGRIKLKDGTVLEIGSEEELFDLGLTDADKNLMHQMQIANPIESIKE